MNSVSLASVVGVTLALGGTTFLAFAKRRKQADPIDARRHLMLTWGGCIALLCVILFWEQRPLSSIGLVAGNFRAWGIGACVGLAVVMSNGLFLRFGKKTVMDGSVDTLLKLAAKPLWFRIAVVFTAGITEEIVFRGYPIERLAEMTGSLWLAALVPLLVFTLAHLSGWSARHLITVFFAGAILTGLYLWQKDLAACMIAHAIIDVPIIFLPLITKKLTAAVVDAKPA